MIHAAIIIYLTVIIYNKVYINVLVLVKVVRNCYKIWKEMM